MVKSDENRDRLKKTRWLRALQLAKLLFEDEGYFTEYLVEIEKLIKNGYPKPNGLLTKLYIVNRETIPVQCLQCAMDCAYYQILQDNASLMLTIDTSVQDLHYVASIVMDFSAENNIEIAIHYQGSANIL